MIPVALGVGILLAILAAASKARAGASPAAAAAAPSGTAASVQKIVASGDPKKIVAAAAVAHQAGEHELSSQLVKEAKNAAVTHPAAAYPSPWPDIHDAAWTTFVRAMRGSDQHEITPGYHLGLFGFGMRRLVDLKLATHPHKIKYKGKAVWNADWVPALQPGPDKFLDDADLQYKAFIRSMNDYANQVKAELPELLGSTLDGRPVTMSGLLAVANQAGWDGLKTWIADPKVRAQYKTTTARFLKLNGVF